MRAAGWQRRAHGSISTETGCQPKRTNHFAGLDERQAVLEIGDGNEHGGTLRWVPFQPGVDGINVLSIQFDEGWRPYESNWPPDRAPLAVKQARLGVPHPTREHRESCPLRL